MCAHVWQSHVTHQCPSDLHPHSQATFRHLFAHCARALQVGPALKIEHALQTMQTVLYALSRKRYNDFAAEVCVCVCV